MIRQIRSLLLAGMLVPVAACGGAGSEKSQVAVQEQTADTEPTAPQAEIESDIDWAAVDSAMGRPGSMQPGGVYKFSMPRSDLSVTSDGVQIEPALALGSWLAMNPSGGDEVVAMGDLVLTEEEYNRVIARLQEGGVGQIAIHKHLPETSPSIWWTHVHGEGDPVEIAATVQAALALTGTPPPSPSNGEAEPFPLDTAQISQILGHDGNVSGGVYHVSVPRPETIQASGVIVPPAMGTATALNFQPTGGRRAAINGDFVMRPDEVQGVIRALKEHGIQVVSLHNHMLDEEPRLLFMHFWANDDAVQLARGLRAALDQIDTPPTFAQ